MNLFELAGEAKYRKITFDAEELAVIRAACAVAAGEEAARLDMATEEGLELFARQIGRANASSLTGAMVALFKPGQEILIEPEDLAPVREHLDTYGPGAPEEHTEALKRSLGKIHDFIEPR